MIKSQKSQSLATCVDCLVRMDGLWTLCTWVSLTSLTEKVRVGQVDLAQTQNGHNLLCLGIGSEIKVYDLLKLGETVAQV